MVDAVRMLFSVVMVTSSVAAVSGNVVLLLVLLLNRDVRSAALGVLLSNGLSDLALGLSIIPLGAAAAAASLAPPGDPVAVGDVGDAASAFCQSSGFVLLLLQTSSLHAVAWTTVHKFTEICLALRHRSVWTPPRGRAALVMVWTVALATAAPPLLGFGRYAYSESRFLCGPSCTPEDRSFLLLWLLLGVGLPLATVCSLCGCIVAVARKQARRGTFRCNELHCFYVPANNYLRSSVVVAATSGCLLLCWLPYISVCLYETFSGRETPPLVAAFSVWLVLSGAALNPWISCLTHTRYRAALRRGVSWLTRRWACPGTTTSELRPPSADLHLHTANHNRISTTTTSSTATTTSTLPPLSPETPTPTPP